MTVSTQPTRPEALKSQIDDLHRPKLVSDDGRHQIGIAPVSQPRITSQGHLVATLAYTRRFRLWRQWREPTATTEPPLAALGLGQS